MSTHLPTPASADLYPGPSRIARVLAPLLTIMLLIAVPLMVGMIWWRWETVSEPSTAIVVGGDGSLDGAKVKVTPIGARDWRNSGSMMVHSWTADLDHENNWQTPILLDPGRYHVLVTHRDHTILDEDFTLNRLRGIRFDLPAMVMLVGGGPITGATVEVSRLGDHSVSKPANILITAADHFRTPVYLLPGKYRIVVRTSVPPVRQLVQYDFDIDRNRTSPLVIDLPREAAIEDGSLAP